MLSNPESHNENPVDRRAALGEVLRPTYEDLQTAIGSRKFQFIHRSEMPQMIGILQNSRQPKDIEADMLFFDSLPKMSYDLISDEYSKGFKMYFKDSLGNLSLAQILPSQIAEIMRPLGYELGDESWWTDRKDAVLEKVNSLLQSLGYILHKEMSQSVFYSVSEFIRFRE